MSNSKDDSPKKHKSRSEKAQEINYPDPDKWFVQMRGDSADFSEPKQEDSGDKWDDV